MGPTNIALVKLFSADGELRAADARLHEAGGSVRQQERRIADLTEKSRLAQTKLRETQSQQKQLELDIRARDEKIERLRQQQQTSRNHKEYQAFLTEINTEKIDKGKVEDELLKVMETVEELTAQLKDLTAQLHAEQERHAATQGQLAGRLAELQAEIDRLRPARDAAHGSLPAKARETFDKLAERYEGEAMSPIGKPDRRTEEYVCTACNMDLFPDVYNRLHARDDLVTCPNCRRLLFIPDDLPPELAINKPKERKELKADKKAVGAPSVRQESAVDVMRSVAQDDGAPLAVTEAAPVANGDENLPPAA
jgi:predicted  nucleic acid-binding Zn-ribbon protein